MSINRSMDKEMVVPIYNRILFTHRKECIWVSFNEVGETRAYYTEWSKSESQKQMLYINTYTWNLEKWYWWTYMLGRNRDMGIQNRFMHTVEEGEVGMNWESSMEIHTLPCVKWIANGKLLHRAGSLAWCLWNIQGWDGMGGRTEVQEGADMCLPLTDSCWCMVETGTTLESIYSPIKNK